MGRVNKEIYGQHRRVQDPELARKAFFFGLSLFIIFTVLTAYAIFQNFEWYFIVIFGMTATCCVTMMGLSKTIV